jgi:hypothetical protein
MEETLPEGWALHQHDWVKAAMMLLGLPHFHDGDDIVVTAGWESMLEGLGFSSDGGAPLRLKNAQQVTVKRLENLRRAKVVLDEERARKDVLEKNAPPSASLQKQEHGNVASV